MYLPDLGERDYSHNGESCQLTCLPYTSSRSTTFIIARMQLLVTEMNELG